MHVFKKVSCAIAFAALVPFAAGATTSFEYTSSPSSWVGAGQTVEVDPSMGFAFNVSRNFDNGVSFAINGFASNPDFGATRWWYLDFSAPMGAALEPGLYTGALRFPFQGTNPGLSFVGNGRGDNQLTGFFDVLSVAYDPSGKVTEFDATFTQYDENALSAWNTGEIRYNVSAVPEPASYALLAGGLMMLAAAAMRRRNHG